MNKMALVLAKLTSIIIRRTSGLYEFLEVFDSILVQPKRNEFLWKLCLRRNAGHLLVLFLVRIVILKVAFSLTTPVWRNLVLVSQGLPMFLSHMHKGTQTQWKYSRVTQMLVLLGVLTDLDRNNLFNNATNIIPCNSSNAINSMQRMAFI